MEILYLLKDCSLYFILFFENIQAFGFKLLSSEAILCDFFKGKVLFISFFLAAIQRSCVF